MSDEERSDVEDGGEEPLTTLNSDIPLGKLEATDESIEEAKSEMESRRRVMESIEDEEIKEYMETRIAQREEEVAGLIELRKKREKRRIEIIEEEKRLEELRKTEEENRRKVEEERKRKKEDEERRVREERENKKHEAEDRMKSLGKRNFVITKKDGSTVEPQDASDEPVQKSKEQLEAEKKAIIAQRVQPLALDGLDEAGLKQKAGELHAQWYKLEGEKYDLDQEYKRKQYDLMELGERARQVNKGKGRQRGMSIVQIDSTFDRMSDKYSQAPPKIQLCSKYERHTDRRTYGERRTVFADDVDGNEGDQPANAITEEAEE